MGMSASQVRYLTLTARIHDVENQAQRIQNQKLLLANDSDEVYQRYLDALDRTKIQVRQFNDEAGTSQMVDVTLDILYKESCNTLTNGYMLTGTDGTLYLPFNVVTSDLENFDAFLGRYKSFLGFNGSNEAFRSNNQQQYNYALAMWKYINEQAGTDMFADLDGTQIVISDNVQVVCSDEPYYTPDGTASSTLRHSVIHCDVPADSINDTNWVRDIIGYGYANFQMMSSELSDYDVNNQVHSVVVDGASLGQDVESYTIKLYSFASSTVSTDTQMGEEADEIELAKAEVEYESDMKKINAKDKRYDTELSTLENQRSAMTEEMQGIKTVIDDNIKRTFKLFS